MSHTFGHCFCMQELHSRNCVSDLPLEVAEELVSFMSSDSSSFFSFFLFFLLFFSSENKKVYGRRKKSICPENINQPDFYYGLTYVSGENLPSFLFLFNCQGIISLYFFFGLPMDLAFSMFFCLFVFCRVR